MLERSMMMCGRRGVVTTGAAIFTVGLFALLTLINRTAEKVTIPEIPPDEAVSAVFQPPEMPPPKKVDVEKPKSEIPQEKPVLEKDAPDVLEINSDALPELFPHIDGVKIGGPAGIYIPDVAVDLGELDHYPEPIQRIAPNYPYEKKREGIDGWARIEFIVEVDGSVSHARIESASDREFGDAGLDALRNWRFRPGMKNGDPVAAWMVQPFDFDADR